MMTTGGPRNSKPGTLNHLFFSAVEKYNKPDAMQVKVGGRYTPISHATMFGRVRNTAIGLAELGVHPGDRIALLSENRPEWAIADYACLASGVTDVPIYPNETPEAAAYIIQNSGAVAAFVSNAMQAAKLAEVRATCPSLKHIIAFEDVHAPGVDHTLADVEARGAAALTPDREAEFRRVAMAVQPDDVATIIYTSGTTGKPKGVMLTHDNLYSNVKAGGAVIPFAGNDTCLSFLPLSHVFERMAGHYLMMDTGTSIAYAESIDTVPANLTEVRPTIVLSVPRLYEKMYARVLDSALAGSAIKKQIFFWARRVADRWADQKLAGREPRGLLALQYTVAQRLVFSKLQARTGGRLRYFVSGGAPLAAEINKFFYAAGLVILEGYGLTETSPVICVNSPNAFRIGTVGKAVPGVEVRIATDGEILTRGPHVMKGYYENSQATAENIDVDGWFATGDIGTLEDDYLRITDRKKDIIVTAGGKNIAPQPIENEIKTNKYISQVVMIGDKRKFPSVLIVPNWDQLEKWATYKNLTWADHAQLLAMPVVQAKMEKEVFAKTASLAHFEQPKKVAVLEHEFTVERGELTPTLKVKRRVVERMYNSVIDDLYREHPPASGPA